MNRFEHMALDRVCAGARSLPFIALVLTTSALLALCLPLLPITEQRGFMTFPHPPVHLDRNKGWYDQERAGPVTSTPELQRSIDLERLRNSRPAQIMSSSEDKGVSNSGRVRDWSPIDTHLDPLMYKGVSNVGKVREWRVIDAGSKPHPPFVGDGGSSLRLAGKRLAESGAVPRRSLWTQGSTCTNPPGVCLNTCCGTSCVDLQADPNHCGHCNHICKWDRTCCNGKCRHLNGDHKNCGLCGTMCPKGTKCLFGLCGY